MSEHPKNAAGGWLLDSVVMDSGPGEIAIALMSHAVRGRRLALRWCESNEVATTWMDRETDWFIVPFTFAAPIARKLVELHATGFENLDTDGMAKLVEWLVENEGIQDGICY